MMDADAQKRMKNIALEYTAIGVAVTTIIGAAFYVGMKIGFGYGLHACVGV
ncbi:MAG: hypothetical protein ABH834_04685 [Candidatus Altiarchaeota archaeon]